MGVDNRAPSPLSNRPFHRANRAETDPVSRAWETMKHTLARLEHPINDNEDFMTYTAQGTDYLVKVWKERGIGSEIALQGLLGVLELCLCQWSEQSKLFEMLVNYLGFSTVVFWKIAVPTIYDSDLSHGTQYRDSLLFSLALYDVNNSKNKMRELYAAVPGVRQSMLGIHAKRFGEKFRHMQNVRSRNSSRAGSTKGSCEDLQALENDVVDAQSDTLSDGLNDGLTSYTLVEQTHSKQRVINVSNAPPVSVQRKNSGSWEIKQGSGGLVACVDPVMSVDRENIWLANLGINIKGDDAFVDEDLPPSTNSLGLPLIKQARAGEIFHVLEENQQKPKTALEEEVERDMSLLLVLHDYNKTNYQLNPVFVNQDDYAAYYGGISNGILWPALHNLPLYIVKDYDDPDVLRDHWCAYVRVNYQFAINATRNSRPQDFIWIHDYHLMLVGQLMRSLDANLEVGFFLHIPFQPPDNFLTKYRVVAEPIIRALLRFTKVGFQTDRDRRKYISLVQKTVPRARIHYEETVDIFMINHEGWTCSLGVFPVSIKNEDFLSIATQDKTLIDAIDIRKEVLANSDEEAKFFFSVERFDYTKGIKEKLAAWRRYFELHPERKGKDVLFQVAVTNRRSVESYRQYQDDCLAIAAEINKTITCEKMPKWKPIIFNTDGLPRAKLIAHYLAMDVGVVTPSKDGMNLVAKEMLICNPEAGLIISSGAGTEVQLGNAGFYTNENRCYHRIDDIQNVDDFAESFYRAATEDVELKRANGSRLSSFLKSHDIDEWSTAFLDPSWTHEVIRPTVIRQLSDFYTLMDKTAQVRRQIVESVLKGLPIRAHSSLSLENAKNSLENSCKQGTTEVTLSTVGLGDELADDLPIKFDISDELSELHKDLAFLQFVESDDVQNVEHFVETLSGFHPDGPVMFSDEVSKACSLLIEGDHFHHVFTDRDGTLKSYSCSYPTSIQPAYSAVIQAQFARKCAQMCAIVTTSPLVHIGILNMMTLPEGYYAFGASAGREWYVNPALQFKDDTVSDDDLNLLNIAFEKVEDLLAQPQFRNFTWIGSGLQKHYGHITIARQDKDKSAPSRLSNLLLKEVANVVKEVDPAGNTLMLKESEYEAKIYTKTHLTGKIFNKGHGVRLVAQKLNLKLSVGNILVCGDSDTDLPMLEVCLQEAKKNVYTIWVTTNEVLKKKVTELCKAYNNDHVVFVSCPGVLLGAMAQATVRVLNVRPGVDDDDKYSGYGFDQ